MSVHLDRIEIDKNLPITYSINIKTLSTPKRPLTCYITATPQTSNQWNYGKPLRGSDKPRTSVHLPVTYSSSVHLPCHPPTITSHSPMILPSQSSYHHHYHYYHHHYYHHRHHHRQPLPLSSRTSTTIKQKILPSPTSIVSTRPTMTSTTTITSPDSSSPSPSKKPNKTIPTPSIPNKRSSHRPSSPTLPSYSALVWNWFHHPTPTKPSPHHKGDQSDYSETYRHSSPNKRSLLSKLLTSSKEKSSKSPRPCFSRKHLASSSSFPTPYHE